jgi:2-amino-4-hydroxy-6-hydroxymethyldihydropteridine diphosphokinase
MSNTAIVGLGSNIEPKKNIESARQLIRGHFTVLAESSFLRNPACGVTKQPEFINGAILVKTDLNQQDCKAVLKDFEKQMGRTPAMTGDAPRVIDFDIHVWNDEIVDPYFYEWPFIRLFVLELKPELHYDHSKLKST